MTLTDPAGVHATAPVTTRRPLWQHALALTAVVLALTPVLGGRGLFSGDEGAAIAQAQLLVDGEGWGFDVPRPDLDPEGDVGPFDRADPVTGAPFAKHPAYPVLLVPFVAVAGTFGAKLASVLGSVLAAVAAALIARRIRPGLEYPTLWVAGLASPLLFNGWVVIGHSLAAAFAGFAALLVAGGFERSSRARLAGVVALCLAAVLLRNEAVLFGVALAAGAAVVAVRNRTTRPAGLAAAALVGTGAGYVLDTWLTGQVASPEGPFVVDQTLNSSNYVAGRLLPTAQTLLMPVRGGVDAWDLLTVLALAGTVLAAVIVRRRPEDDSGIVLASALGAGAALLRLAGPPTAVPGLLTAFPLLAVGLVVLSRRQARRSTPLLLAVTSALFVGAVLATQYETGGTAEWGFRYGTLALPLLVPLAMVGLADAAPRLTPAVRAVALGALLVVSGALAALSLRTLDYQHRITIQAVETVERVRAVSDRPVVVTSYLPLGRMAWAEILAGEDWTLVEEGEAEPLVARLTDDGGDVVLVSQDPEVELEPFADTHEVVLRVPAVPRGQLEVVRLVAR